MRINIKKRVGFKLGLTMIELLVAVSVLVILILIFSRVLAQAQKVVDTTQESMKLNNSSGAIARVIQQDMLKISNIGFLCIMDNYVTPTIASTTETWPQMRMYFATPGMYEVKYVDRASGASAFYCTGCVVGLGMCQQNSDSADEALKILWRGAWGLTPTTSIPSGYSYSAANDMKICDIITQSGYNDFSDIATSTRDALFSSWVYGIDSNFAPDDLAVPPTKIDDVKQIWKYLAVNCKKLSIMWTKGDINTSTNKLIWYGRDIDGNFIKPTDFNASAYSNPNSELEHNDLMYNAGTMGINYIYTNHADITSGIDDTSKWKFEFINTLSRPWLTNGQYVAFWTPDMPIETWPKAIKITIELSDGGKGDTEVIKRYEIIRYIGQ